MTIVCQHCTVQKHPSFVWQNPDRSKRHQEHVLPLGYQPLVSTKRCFMIVFHRDRGRDSGLHFSNNQSQHYRQESGMSPILF